MRHRRIPLGPPQSMEIAIRIDCCHLVAVTNGEADLRTLPGEHTSSRSYPHRREPPRGKEPRPSTSGNRAGPRLRFFPDRVTQSSPYCPPGKRHFPHQYRRQRMRLILPSGIPLFLFQTLSLPFSVLLSLLNYSFLPPRPRSRRLFRRFWIPRQPVSG